MVYLRSTKNTHVYTNTDKDIAIPTLYIQNEKLPGKPREIKVTIEEVE